MGQREAFQVLTSNTNLARGVPRLVGSGRKASILPRKFVSTSKTPKISNRPAISQKLPHSGVKLFVNTPRPSRHTRPPLHSVRAPTSTRQRKVIMLKSALAGREESSVKKRLTDDLKTIHWTEASSNEDMDLCSDSDISLDSESSSSPRSASRPLPTVLHYQPSGADLHQGQATHTTQSRVERFSSFVSNVENRARRGYQPSSHATGIQTPPSCSDENIKRDNYVSSKITKNAFKALRDTPVDSTVVLTKWLQGSASVLHPEATRDTAMPDSNDCSDMTDSTLMGMPSFPPRDALLDDFIEEWSLPDEETNEMIIFSLQGRQYVHDPLPPGWVMRVSKTRQRPFYIHPDHGVTWHCPIILKPKSEALVLRRSSLRSMKQQAQRNRATSPVFASSPTPHPFSLEGSMSELIHHYNDPQTMDGYEGSVSSTSTTDSGRTSTAPSTLTTAHREDHILSGHQDTNDWVTPLRLDMVTPLHRPRHLEASTKQFSLHRLSPIPETRKEIHSSASSQLHLNLDTPIDLMEEDFMEDSNHWVSFRAKTSSNPHDSNGKSSTELVHPTPRSQRSTPRVSFEPMEIASHERATQDEGRANEAQLFLGPSPKSPVQLRHVNHTSTPISDTDDTTEVTDPEHCQGTIVVESTCHSLAFRPRYTPMTTPLHVASDLRHIAMKNEVFQLISLSHTKTLGDIHSTLQRTPMPSLVKSPPTLKYQTALTVSEAHSKNKKVNEPESCQSPLQMATNGIHCREGFSTGCDEPVSRLARKETHDVSQSVQTKSVVPTSASFTPASRHMTTGSKDREEVCSPNYYCTPSQSLGESSHDSPVMQSQRSNSASRRDRHPSSPSTTATVRTPLSIDIPESSPDKSFQALPNDDYESEESISDTKMKSKTKSRPFNWRVLHPAHPICSLQRLDELLREQRESGRNVKNQRPTRAQRRKDTKKILSRVNHKQQP